MCNICNCLIFKYLNIQIFTTLFETLQNEEVFKKWVNRTVQSSAFEWKLNFFDFFFRDSHDHEATAMVKAQFMQLWDGLETRWGEMHQVLKYSEDLSNEPVWYSDH